MLLKCIKMVEKRFMLRGGVQKTNYRKFSSHAHPFATPTLCHPHPFFGLFWQKIPFSRQPRKIENFIKKNTSATPTKKKILIFQKKSIKNAKKNIKKRKKFFKKIKKYLCDTQP